MSDDEQLEEDPDVYDRDPLSVGFSIFLERGFRVVETEVGKRPEGPTARARRHQQMAQAIQDVAREIDPEARAVLQPEQKDYFGMFPEWHLTVWSDLTDPNDIWVLRKHLFDSGYWVGHINISWEPVMG